MSESTRHTPGPWRIRIDVDRGGDLKGVDKYFYIVAGKEEWKQNKGHFHPDDALYPIDEIDVVGLGHDRDYGYPEGGIRNEADARLIAAAPEMLQALEACESLIEFYAKREMNAPANGEEAVRDTREKLQLYRNALKKARGSDV